MLIPFSSELHFNNSHNILFVLADPTNHSYLSTLHIDVKNIVRINFIIICYYLFNLIVALKFLKVYYSLCKGKFNQDTEGNTNC